MNCNLYPLCILYPKLPLRISFLCEVHINFSKTVSLLFLQIHYHHDMTLEVLMIIHSDNTN
jgi:hypothetical protein